MAGYIRLDILLGEGTFLPIKGVFSLGWRLCLPAQVGGSPSSEAVFPLELEAPLSKRFYLPLSPGAPLE